MKKYSLIYLCGGVGARATRTDSKAEMSASVPKQFKKINGIPMLIYGLLAVNKIDQIDEVIINYPDGFLETLKNMLSNYHVTKTITFVEAGKTRQASVQAMLKMCKNDHVIVHEAARPLVTEADFHSLIETDAENVSFLCEIPFSVAAVEPKTKRITGKLDRSTIRNVQLPQKFSRELLARALEKADQDGCVYTEETAACLAIEDADIRFIEGHSTNIKITYTEDFVLADVLVRGVEKNA